MACRRWLGSPVGAHLIPNHERDRPRGENKARCTSLRDDLASATATTLPLANPSLVVRKTLTIVPRKIAFTEKYGACRSVFEEVGEGVTVVLARLP